jgi:hypothetical protein
VLGMIIMLHSLDQDWANFCELAPDENNVDDECVCSFEESLTDERLNWTETTIQNASYAHDQMMNLQTKKDITRS